MKFRIKFFSIIFLLIIPVSICNNDFMRDSVEERQVDDIIMDRGKFHAKNSIPTDSDNELYDDERTYWDNDDEYDSIPTYSKRAPSSAFVGVRGKKLQDRAPSGFLGVRGKKNNYIDSPELEEWTMTNNNENGHNNDNNLSDYLDEYFVNGGQPERKLRKRKPQGFVGLRGKKSETPEFMLSKRVPVTGFFGMRGKKEPLGYQSSGFFGVRKKPSSNPYLKFVGVRGKKAVKRDTRNLRFDESSQFNLMNGLRKPQRRGSGTPPDKNIGFIGMRG